MIISTSFRAISRTCIFNTGNSGHTPGIHLQKTKQPKKLPVQGSLKKKYCDNRFDFPFLNIYLYATLFAYKQSTDKAK